MLKIAPIIFFLLTFASYADHHPKDEIIILVETDISSSIQNKKCEGLKSYLEKKLPIYDFKFLVTPPSDHTVFYDLVIKDKVDYFISNPVTTVELLRMHQSKPLLTRINEFGSSMYGSVFFTGSSGHINHETDHEIYSKNNTLAGTNKNSGDWLFGYDYLQSKNIDPFEHFNKVSFLGDAQNVVMAVVGGSIDIGLIRTGVLEGMVEQGLIKDDDFRILNESDLIELNFGLTTALYPEWSFSATSNEDVSVSEELKEVLLEFKQQGGFSRWKDVENYVSVKKTLRKYRMGSYSDPEHIKFYKENYIIFLIILLLALFIILYLKKKSDSEIIKYKANLERLSRNDSLNRLLSEVTHELSQPITSIEIDSEIIKELSGVKNSKEREKLKEVSNSMSIKTKHCADIISGIRSFLVTKEINKGDFMLSSSVSKVFDLMKRDIEDLGITYEDTFNYKGSVYMSSIEFEQVLLNLLKNSISVIKDNDKKENNIKLVADSDSKFSYLEVSDSGGNIENTDVLFELFKSTKRKNSHEGLGLGLNLSRSLMRSNGGDLYLKSSNESGSVFVIKIPLRNNE